MKCLGDRILWAQPLDLLLKILTKKFRKITSKPVLKIKGSIFSNLS